MGEKQGGPDPDATQAAASAARRKVATGPPDNASGPQAVSSYVDHLRLQSRSSSRAGMEQQQVRGPNPQPASAAGAALQRSPQSPSLKAGALCFHILLKFASNSMSSCWIVYRCLLSIP